ncbi:MAG TPA: HEAT repeat domain-containing protein [Terriglobales bacterium]|nr:HEAT repeat domain-containing protein [Terriglobales bacterium]
MGTRDIPKKVTEGELYRALLGLNARTQTAAFEAAKFLYDKAAPELEAHLIHILKNGRRPFNRAAAAYVMQMVTTKKTFAALERTVGDEAESPRVRGEAAEALAHSHRRKSHDVLLRNLNDKSKDVRFWCAFALGQMAERRAVPILLRLADSDKRPVRGFHSVSQEARDAIRNIEIENKEHRRKHGCVFCKPL